MENTYLLLLLDFFISFVPDKDKKKVTIRCQIIDVLNYAIWNFNLALLIFIVVIGVLRILAIALIAVAIIFEVLIFLLVFDVEFHLSGRPFETFNHFCNGLRGN